MRPVVIAGGGLTAQRCAEALRRGGHPGRIVIVTDEEHAPYDRPPLSKELLAGAIDGTPLRPAGWYAEHDVELLLESRATGIDLATRELLLGEERLPYGDLVIATGADARRLSGGAHTLRSLADARRLRAALHPGARLAIVGGGLIGQEVAATAAGLGVHVVLLERGPAPMAAVLGEEIADRLAAWHRGHGIRLETGAEVATIEPGAVMLRDRRRFAADAVLVAIGGSPAVGWLRGTPLHDPSGIPVDENQRTAIPHIYAAGDCARPHGDRPYDHWEAAARQGTVAARAILGEQPSTAPPPPHSFWSDQHGTRLHVLGEPAAASRVEIEGELPDLRALYRDRHDRLTGAFLAGRPREMAALRREIHNPEPLEERSAA